MQLDNGTFAATDKQFREACELVGIQPTAAQASKWRRKQGLAYSVVVGGRKIEDVGPVKQINAKAPIAKAQVVPFDAPVVPGPEQVAS